MGNSTEAILDESGFSQIQPRNLAEIVGIELPGYWRIAGNVLDSMKISEREKVDIFEYFLWQESGAGELKKLRDIREGELVSLWERVSEDEATKKYDAFYSSYNTVAYFLNIKSPPKNREKATNKFRKYSLNVADARNDHPEWTYDDIAREVGGTYSNVQSAMRVLIQAELVQKGENSRILHRNEQDVRDEEAIYKLRVKNPEMSQSQIRKKLKLSKGRVGYFISKGIKEGKIERKRALPNREI